MNNLLVNFTGNHQVIKLNIQQGSNTYYPISLIISLIMGAYQLKIEENNRILYLSRLITQSRSSKEARYHLKLWVKNIFIDFDRNIKSNPIWFEHIKMILGKQHQRKQIYLSKLVAQQVNKHLRIINPNLKYQLLSLIFDNHTLDNLSLKIIMKHYEYLGNNLKQKVNNDNFIIKYETTNYFTLFIQTKNI